MKRLDNAFQEFELAPSEEQQGQMLNLYQKARLQNLRADFAKQKIGLRYDPSDPSYGLLVAELDGKILLLSQLLDDAEAAEVAIVTSNQPNRPTE